MLGRRDDHFLNRYVVFERDLVSEVHGFAQDVFVYAAVDAAQDKDAHAASAGTGRVFYNYDAMLAGEGGQADIGRAFQSVLNPLLDLRLAGPLTVPG